MNDPFALNLTINLLLLGVGGAMFAGNLFAYINKRQYIRRIWRIYKYLDLIIYVPI